MISVEKTCNNCYHQRKMSCPSSDRCYDKESKPFFVLNRSIMYEPKVSKRSLILGFFKRLFRM